LFEVDAVLDYTVLSTGDVVIAGGFRLDVVATGASDNHLVSSHATDPIKVKVLKHNNIWPMLAFNPNADGTTDDKTKIDFTNNSGDVVDLGGKTYEYNGTFTPVATFVNGMIIDDTLTRDFRFKTAAAFKDARVNLIDFMDRRFGAGVWTYRTGVGVGSDAGLAMNDALAHLRAEYGRGELFIPPTGSFLVTTPPTAVNVSGQVIRGMKGNTQASQLVYNASTGALFSFTGDAGNTGGGVHDLGLLLESGLGSTSSWAISSTGDATYQNDELRISNLYITSLGASDYWYRGIDLNGVSRTSPQGIRNSSIEDVSIFNCNNAGAIFTNAVTLRVNNLGIYTGTGTGGNIYVGGGGAANTNSIQIELDQINCSELNVTNTTKIFVRGNVNQFNTGTSCDFYDIVLFKNLAKAGTLGANGQFAEY